MEDRSRSFQEHSITPAHMKIQLGKSSVEVGRAQGLTLSAMTAFLLLVSPVKPRKNEGVGWKTKLFSSKLPVEIQKLHSSDANTTTLEM